MKIFFIGMMGSGKTTLAKKLSDLTNKPYVDIDELIELEENMSISEIFSNYGEDYFRKIEHIALRSIGNSEIISCGGGIIINKNNRKFLNENGFTIYLKTSLSLLAKRLNGENRRPLLKNKDLQKTLDSIYHKRKKLYEDTADLIIETDGKSLNRITSIIQEKFINEENHC
tara:strand:- start:1289 stop:1801 length:513 start_codon:yes stop_codon:yes gene_type:complete